MGQTMIKLECGTCGEPLEKRLGEYNARIKKNSNYVPFCSISCARSHKTLEFPCGEAIKLYTSGLSSIDIANKFGVSDSFVRKTLKSKNVYLRTKSENAKLKNPMGGKTHSDETKEKLRRLTHKQFESKEAREAASHKQIEFMKNNPNKQQRSKLEFTVEKELDKLGIKYKSPYPVQDLKTGKFKALADIYLVDYNAVIEVNGTYWHSDPRFYPSGAMTDSQKHVEDKYSKKLEFYKLLGIEVVELWEYDIKQDATSTVINKLKEVGIISE